MVGKVTRCKRRDIDSSILEYDLNVPFKGYNESLTVGGNDLKSFSTNSVHMMTQSLRRPFGRGIIYGAIGGFIGGLVMYAVMSGIMLAINLGANCFAVIIALITDQPYSNGLVPLGVSIHLITSTVIGAIFGLVISAVNKLRITGFAKGIGFGVATGLIAFVIIFLPIAMTVMPPKMMDLMNAMNSQTMMSGSNGKGAMMSGSSSGSGMMSTNKMSSSSDTPSASGGMTEKSTMTENSGMNGKSGMMSTSSSSGMNSQMAMMPNMASLQSSIIGGSLLGHVVYGAVLGSIVTVLLRKTRSGEAKINR